MKRMVNVRLRRPSVGADDLSSNPIYDATYNATQALFGAMQDPGKSLQGLAQAGQKLAQGTPIAPPGATQAQQQQAQQALQQGAAAAAQAVSSAAASVAQPVVDRAAQQAGQAYGQSFWSNFPVWGKVAVGVGLLAAVAAVATGVKKR
jgi:hypothetical protein